MTGQMIQNDKYNITCVTLGNKLCGPLLAYPQGLTLSETQYCGGSPSRLIYLIKLTVKTFNLCNSGALEEGKKRKN